MAKKGDDQKTPPATLLVIDGGGDPGPIEPDWKLIYNEALDRHNAALHWRSICSEMRQANTLAPVNGPQIHRLVTLRIQYERAEINVIENGVVKTSKKGGQTYNLHFFVMRGLQADMLALEAALGLSPNQRAKAAKIDRKQSKPRAADAYLKKAP